MRIEERSLDLRAEEGARAVVLALLAEASVAAERLAAGSGDEPLHDFRVALRRLRTALRSFRPLLQERVRPRHERRLRKVARSTNEARDAEVQLAWLAASRDAFASPARRAGYDLLVARCEARAHGGPDPARVTGKYRLAADELQRRLGAHERELAPEGGASPSFASALASRIGDEVGALSRRMRAIRSASDEEGVHRARIEGKRLRYLLEPLRGCRRADASAAIGHLKRLQDVLGELHDTHVLAGELRETLSDVSADRPRPGPRPGLLALARLARERRDGLYAELERGWRAGGMDALAAEARAIAAALEAREAGKRTRRREASAPPGRARGGARRARLRRGRSQGSRARPG